MKKYLLALDEGTTSARAILFDRYGGIVAMANQAIRQIYPPVSLSSSLKILRRLGGALQASGTEKDSPMACPGS